MVRVQFPQKIVELDNLLKVSSWHSGLACSGLDDWHFVYRKGGGGGGGDFSVNIVIVVHVASQHC